MRPAEDNNDGVFRDELFLAAAQQLVAYEEAKAAESGMSHATPMDAELREQLASNLACVDLLHRVWPDFDLPSPAVNETPPPKVLGDFRLICELGHGGMGTVFEAEQISMGRRVALKVLPFAAMVQDKSLERFRNEVRAAAALDHPHIISVYSIGEERGVHFYAMQLIRGQTLAEAIAQVRKLREPVSLHLEEGKNSEETPTDLTAARSQQSTQRIEEAFINSAAESRPAMEAYRSAARLGIQAAEALQHAHDQGVLHRDIKPSNLMLDADGKLFITDFGLARIEADAGLTKTGDIVGTLRYMAPEQALAKRVVIDHRADIYSLGATLYELLTLQPAFAETDRAELLKQIAFEEPRPLRKIERRIPEELETIVLRAMAKQPEERYQTAQQLADDLRAFLENRPLKAKQPTIFKRVVKWSRRHRPVVWASVATLLISALVVTGNAGWVIRDRQARQVVVENRVQLALEDIKAAYEEDKLPNAFAALKQAESILSTSDSYPHIRDRVRRWRADLEMVQRLELARFDKSTMVGADRWELTSTPESYAKAFVEHGLDFTSCDHLDAVSAIRGSSIKPHLIAAIDDWATIEGESERMKLLQLARDTDDDPWRNSLRDTIESDDIAALKVLAEDEYNLAKSRATIVTVINLLIKAGERKFAIDKLRQMQRNHPTDFWINYTLGTQLEQARPHEAVGHLTIALSQRPNSGATHNALGNAFYFTGDFARTEIEFRQAARLQPDQIWHRTNHADILAKQGRFVEAEENCREAIRAFPDSATLQGLLANTLASQDKVSEAEASYREAIRLDNSQSRWFVELAMLLFKQKKQAAANAVLEDLFSVESAEPPVLDRLAWRLATSNSEEIRNGKLAVKAATKACELTSYKQASMLDTLAAAYAATGDFESAVKWSEQALALADDERLSVSIKKHLDSFKSGQPRREP